LNLIENEFWDRLAEFSKPDSFGFHLEVRGAWERDKINFDFERICENKNLALLVMGAYWIGYDSSRRKTVEATLELVNSV